MTENEDMMEQMRQMMGQDMMMDNNMMEDPETRNMMVEHTEQFQELRSQKLDEKQFNPKIMKQHMEKIQDLMKDNDMHQTMHP